MKLLNSKTGDEGLGGMSAWFSRRLTDRWARLRASLSGSGRREDWRPAMEAMEPRVLLSAEAGMPTELLVNDAAGSGMFLAVVEELEAEGGVEGEGPSVDTDGDGTPDQPQRPLLRVQGAATAEGAEGERTALTFPVSLSRPLEHDLNVFYASLPGSATPGEDFDPVSGMLTIPAGETEALVEVPVIGDDVTEPDEVMGLRIFSSSAVLHGQHRAAGHIYNDDGAIDQPDIRVLDENGLPVHWHFFGGVDGGEREPFTFTVQNAGDQTLTVTEALGLAGTGFSVEPANGPGENDDWQLEPGESIPVTVTFDATEDVHEHTALVLRSNDPDEAEYPIALFGTGLPFTGTEPAEPTPEQLDLQYRITNQGDDAVWALLRMPDPSYLVTEWGEPQFNEDGTVPEDGVISVDVEMIQITEGNWPTVVTPHAHRYNLGDLPDGEYTFNFNVNGEFIEALPFEVGGPQPDIDLETEEQPDDVHGHRFDRLQPGESATQDFTIRNEGDAPLELREPVGLNNPALSFEVILPDNEADPATGGDQPANTSEDPIGPPDILYTLQPGETLKLSVTYSPDEPGIDRGTLRFYSNDPDEPIYWLGIAGTAELEDQWVDFVPRPGMTEVEVTPNESNESDAGYTATVSLTFPHSGFRVVDWGEVQQTTTGFVVNADVERWTGAAADVITTETHEYDLGELEDGRYQFVFQAHQVPVARDGFIVGEGEMPKQAVWGTPGAQLAAPGEDVSVDVRYGVSGGMQNLTGLGLRMHFDTSVLSFQELTDVLANGLQAEPVLEEDLEDHDNDPSTDAFVRVAWADTAGTWPGQDLPVSLFSADFTVVDDVEPQTRTAVRFTPISAAADYDFASRPAHLGVKAPTTLDFDGDGEQQALTDGLLAVRYLLGFRGEALVRGVIGSDATRTAAEIEAALGSADAASLLDVDGNGELGGLTDGLLIARHLFGFNGNALTRGAMSRGGERNSAGSIRDHLERHHVGANDHTRDDLTRLTNGQRLSELEDEPLAERDRHRRLGKLLAAWAAGQADLDEPAAEPESALAAV